MTTANIQGHCSLCAEENTYLCTGCSVYFCFDHLKEHRDMINQEFNQMKDNYNLLIENLNEHINNPDQRLFIKQINQWKQKSIQRIEQVAQQCEGDLIECTNKHFLDLKNDLNEKLKENRVKDKSNEKQLNQLKEQLKLLNKQFEEILKISFDTRTTSFINQIYFKQKQLILPNISVNCKWKQNAITQIKGHTQEDQLSGPGGIYIDDDQNIYIVDSGNDRIVKWKSGEINGQVVAGGNGKGSRNDQLDYPTAVIVDKETDSLIICDWRNRRVIRWPRQNGRSGETIISDIACWDLMMNSDRHLYVCDTKKHEVRRWKMGQKDGTIVAGGNGKGDRLNQLNTPCYIFVDDNESVYVSDCWNHRVMKWMKCAKEGVIVVGDQGQGNSLTQLSRPTGIIVDQLGTLYVADQGNDRVMRWLKGAKEGSVVVGGNERGVQPNQFICPADLSFDGENNLYVVDAGNHRVSKFDLDLN